MHFVSTNLRPLPKNASTIGCLLCNEAKKIQRHLVSVATRGDNVYIYGHCGEGLQEGAVKFSRKDPFPFPFPFLL